jgi:HD-GYP domain-containing protein (c-di-GMP phosphodiesterase class II)
VADAGGSYPGSTPRSEPLDPAIVAALVKSLELKDGATASHTWRVVLYTRALAEAAGLDHDTIGRLTVAAALHDLGKIDIPDDILLKPSKLTEDEFAVIKTHPSLGHERLVRMGVTDRIVLDLVRHHHERVDGEGYPDRLAGDAIPVGARFFAVVDTFDALTSVRPYRRQLGDDAAKRAIDIITKDVDSHYAVEAVDLFVREFDRGALEWILHYFNDENPAPEYAGGPNALAEAVKRLRKDTPRPAPGANPGSGGSGG